MVVEDEAVAEDEAVMEDKVVVESMALLLLLLVMVEYQSIATLTHYKTTPLTHSKTALTQSFLDQF